MLLSLVSLTFLSIRFNVLAIQTSGAGVVIAGLDQADACIYGIGAIGKQLEGGFAQTPVNWSGTGGTPVIWSRGAAAIDPQNNQSTELAPGRQRPYNVYCNRYAE